MTADTGSKAGVSDRLADTIGMTYAARELLARIRTTRPARSLLAALTLVGRLGFSRQAGLVAARRIFPHEALTPARRLASLMVGALLVGTGVALLTQAQLGLSPHDVLVSGLMPRIGLSFGQTVMVVSGFMFLIAAILGQRPSRWGIGYVFAIGIAVDAVAGTLNSPESLLGQMAFVAVSLVSIAAGVSLVVHSGSTGGSMELLMRVGELRGMDRRRVRTSLEVGILVLGICLGGSFGPATIVVALSIGPLLGVMSQAFADHSMGRTARLIAESPEARHPSAMTATQTATR